MTWFGRLVERYMARRMERFAPTLTEMSEQQARIDRRIAITERELRALNGKGHEPKAGSL